MKGEKQNMNKFLTKLAKLFIGISMAAGVGAAIGSIHKEVQSTEAVSSYDDLTLVTSSSTLDTSKKYVYGTGKTSGSNFLVVSGAKSSWGDTTTTLSSATEFEVSAADVTSFYLKGSSANVSALTSNSFSAVTSTPGSGNLSALNSSGNLTHKTTTARNLRFVSGSGWRWYASNTGVAGYLYEVASGPAADVVLSTSNKPYTSTSSSNTSVTTNTLDGIEYENKGGYIYNSYLSFNRSCAGAYLQNNTSYGKYISKIVVNYYTAAHSYFTMYEGATAGAETSTVSSSGSSAGNVTYTFSGTNEFFKFKYPNSQTSVYPNISSISIYLGNDVTPSYTVTKNATNCTIAGDTTITAENDAVYTITPSTNYKVPTSITVTRGGSAFSSYTYSVSNNVGTLTIPKAQITGNFVITASSIATYEVTGSITNGTLSVPGRIDQNGSLNVTIIPSAGYGLPENASDITVTNATRSSYDNSTGVVGISNPTGAVTVTVTCPALGNTYSITTTVSGGTYSGDSSITDNGGVASVTISATGDHKLPSSLPSTTVEGADFTYNSSTGVISLSNATANVVINVTCPDLTSYTITVNETNGSHTGASTIKESRTASLTFTPASGYGQPSSVTVSGATSSWTRGTGVLSLSNPTGNVIVTYTAVGNELDSISISTNSGSYTLGDNFVMPTVTAKYTVNADADVTSSASYSGYDPYTTGSQPVTISYTEGGITKTQSYTAIVSAQSVGYSYNKISSVSDITEGDYIIAYSSYGFDGRDAGNGYTSVTVSNDSIAGTAAMDKLAVHIVPVTGGYTMQLSSTNDNNPSKYVSFTSNSNSLSFADEAKTVSIATATSSTHLAYADGGYAIGDSSTYLSWNSNSGSSNQRYRFYKVSTTTNTNNNSGMAYKAPELYKKISSGTADLIRITATYKGGDKYVGDPISTSDFTVKKQLNTGNELTDVASGYTISANTLTAESNSITVSYTEGGVTKTAIVVVSATEREASLEHVVLNVGENAKLDGYVYWSGAEWDLTDITVTYDWDDDDFDETVDLQDLVDSEDATLSPATPTLGATSFTVSYSYLEKNIENATVTLDKAVVADYVSSVSWSGKSLANFKAFSGQELTASTVNSWTVKATYAGAGETNALSFGTGANQFTIRIGDSKAVTSLPYTWTTADDNQFVYVVVGGVAKGDSTYAKTNICATINAIDHSETSTGEIEKSVTWSKDDSIAAYGTTSLCDDGVALDENIFMQGAKGDAGTEIRFWSDGIRTYTGGNTLTFTPSNGAIITKITLPTVTVTSDSTSSASSPYTITDGDSAVVFEIGSKSTIGSDIVVEYTIEGSETTTVHYANDMNHFDAQKKVVEFAKFMNTTMNGTNVCSGTFANLESAWGDVAGKYDELFGAETTLNETELAWAKNMLKYANATWGSDAEAACVEKAMKTYEHCVSKYDLDAFMSPVRSVSSVKVSPLVNIIGENTNTVAMIVIISMVSVTAIGGYFFLRKRKEN